MTALDTDDLAVVTGPLTIDGEDGVYFAPGEVVRVIEGEDPDGHVYAHGLETDLDQYIDASSLTPLSDIHADTDIEWGEKPYVTYTEIHDYVYEEDNE